MIPMSCPNCGRRGNVPPDRLNSRLHCKKCDAVFYMDATGQVILGDPSDTKKKGRAPKPAKAPRASQGGSTNIGAELAELFERIPKPLRVGGGIAAVLALIYFFVPMPSLGGKPLPGPDDLIGRAGYVTEFAFIDENPSYLSKITAPGTEDAARQWIQQLRPKFNYTGPKRQGNIVMITGWVEQKDDSAGTAMVIVSLLPPHASPKRGEKDKPGHWPGYRVNGQFVMPTYWTKSPDGQWLLDGAKTLESVESAPTETASAST